MQRLMLLLILALTTSAGAVPPETPLLGSSAASWDEIQPRAAAGASRRQVFQAPTATLDDLEVHVTTLAPGQVAHPPHKHPDEEIIIIKEGNVEALVAGENRRLGPGSILFQAAQQLHGIRNVGETPATYYVIRWNSPGMLKARQNP